MADCCILFTTTLQKQNAAPRFPLVSFCLFCLIPAVLLLSSKTASAYSKRQKGYRFNRCPWVCMYYTCNQFPNHRISHTRSIKIYEAITTAISIPIYKKDIFGSIKLGISFRRNTIPAITPLVNKRINEKSIILCMLTVRLCGSNPIFGVHKKKT